MNQKYFLLTVGLALCVPLAAQEDSFDSEPSNAIVVSAETEFEIINEGKAYLRVRRVEQILNEKAKERGEIIVEESPFIKCKKLFGQIRDAAGTVVKKTDKKDINKAQVSVGYALYEESRYQWIELYWNSYPYTIEYEYEVEMSSLFFWPDWYPQDGAPVLAATYNLIIHDPQIRFQTYPVGIEVEPVYTETGNRREWTWKLTALKPRRKEPYMPPEARRQMALYFAPETFKLGNSRGSFQTWDDVAKWYHSLARDKYQLPPQAKEKVQELIAGAQNDREKIQRLYSFLQNYTRYVAIYLDIGGWQPNSCVSVFENKYGDCKDLSTLMLAMLAEAGITAYPALMLTRDEGVLIRDFPSNQFNHVLPFVPLENDTIWLECTADYLVAGELPDDREGCEVLAVKESGGEIISTPLSRSEDNLSESRINARLTTGGALVLSGEIHARGKQAQDLRVGLVYRKPDEQKDLLRNRVLGRNVPQLALENYTIGHLTEDYHLPLAIEFSGTVTNFAPASARRLFLNPNILNQVSRASAPGAEERKFPVYYRYAYMDVDSVEIELPAGFSIESAPPPQDIEAPFGLYQTKYSLEGRRLRYRRVFRLEQKLIPPGEYEAYRDFLREISKNDNAQFVFKK